MADILPEIHELAPGLEPSARLEDAAQARFRMFESIRQFIASLNSDRTVMLVLDDLHWADTPSLRLLEFLAPEFADNRLLLVGVLVQIDTNEGGVDTHLRLCPHYGADRTAFQTAAVLLSLRRSLPRLNCPLWIRRSSSMPAIVTAAVLNHLNPSIGPMRSLTPR
jgi:hypothetical protein